MVEKLNKCNDHEYYYLSNLKLVIIIIKLVFPFQQKHISI